MLFFVVIGCGNGCRSNKVQSNEEPREAAPSLQAFGKQEAASMQTLSAKVYWNVACAVRCESFLVDADTSLFAAGAIKTYFENQIGLYPAIRQDGTWENGGLPQVVMADTDLWSRHVDALEDYVARTMEESWSGYAVIDYEHWVPIWTEGRSSKNIYRLPEEYKQASIELELRINPELSRREAEQLARQRFEAAALEFMLKTLEAAQSIRPNAKWGYYGYPGRLRTWHRTDKVAIEQNAKLATLFEKSDVLYPSVYLLSRTKSNRQDGNASLEETRQYIDRNIREARRLAGEKPVIAFTWYRYHKRGGGNEYGGEFLTDVDVHNQFVRPLESGADGIILWGGSADKKTRQLDSLQWYISTLLEPELRAARSAPQVRTVE